MLLSETLHDVLEGKRRATKGASCCTLKIKIISTFYHGKCLKTSSSLVSCSSPCDHIQSTSAKITPLLTPRQLSPYKLWEVSRPAFHLSIVHSARQVASLRQRSTGLLACYSLCYFQQHQIKWSLMVPLMFPSLLSPPLLF